jgi:Rrf2 family transcriptional regulator, nitric oxide-sensitive transcriptional repressor
MLTNTSLSALRALLYLSRQETTVSIPPHRIAEAVGESPTYLAKVVRLLVKAGILRADRGMKGGVRLNADPAQVTLLSIVEACQGAIVGSYCRASRPDKELCSFHRAALELQGAIRGVLEQWSLEQLLEQPYAADSEGEPSCIMARGRFVENIRTAAAGRDWVSGGEE